MNNTRKSISTDMDEKDKGRLVKFLKTQNLMSLATSDGKGKLWSATVYYLFDNELNFYFLSPTDTVHCKNIAKNPNVSFTIADSDQNASKKKVGLQVAGKAEKVKGAENIKAIIKMWNNLHKDTPSITYKRLKKVWSSRFYKITPSKIQWFNEKLYGEEGIRELKL